MKKLVTRTGAGLALLSLVAGMAFAAPPKKSAKKTVECPVCHMALASKKGGDNTVAVKLKKGDKTMYCCTKCTMPDEVLVKPKGGKAKPGGKM